MYSIDFISLRIFLVSVIRLHTFEFIDIYDDVCILLFLHVLFFSYFLHMFLDLYNLSILHT